MNIKKMNTTNRREYDDNIYIKTKLCIYIFSIYTVYFLFIHFNNIEHYES